eukprot:2264346-Amphidinium_carterae.1
MPMATGAVLAEVNYDQKECLYGALSDISNFFYWLVTPEWLREFCCLPAIHGRYLREQKLTAFTHLWDEAEVFPQLRVVPMGWTWAAYYAHKAHMYQLK